MTDRTITLTPTEAEKFTALAVGESMWITRAGREGYRTPDSFPEPLPPVELMQACAPCERADSDEPDLHRLFMPGGDCAACRVELVGPCPTCEVRHRWCGLDGKPKCDAFGMATLGCAYAVGQPLPIVLFGSGHGTVGKYVVVVNQRIFVITNETFPVDSDEVTAHFAHYDLATLPGQYAIEVHKA